MEFSEVIRRRRSVRQFRPCQIDDEVVMRIIDAGRIAPSGCNRQNKEFIVIRDRAVLRRLDELVQPAFGTAAAAIALVMDPAPTPWGEYWVEDAAAAAQSMLLAAVNEGYDSVWIEGTLLKVEAQAKQLLGVPAERRLYVLLPLGKAVAPGDMAPKAGLQGLVHLERYGG